MLLISIYQKLYGGLHKNIKPLFLKLIIRTVLWAANLHITIIFERSCDTEDWSNDAENSALHHMNKLHLKTY